MKSKLMLAIGLVLAGTAAVTFAQTSAPAAGKPGHHANLDANSDGVIDRSEAAKMPKFAERFDSFDKNNDGRISADERPQRGMRDGKGGRGDHMARIDANGDGTIDRSEAAKMPKFAERFDSFDKNKDGRISADERPQRGMHGGKGRHGARGERMAQLDTNKDGRFSRTELAGKERALQNFAAADANRDGFLTREEMAAHHQAHRGEHGAQPSQQPQPKK